MQLLETKTALENQGVVFNSIPEVVNHMGRAHEVELLEVAFNRGAKSLAVKAAEDVFIPMYNEAMIAAAKAAIEQDINREEKARQEAEKAVTEKLAAAEKARQEAEERAVAKLAAVKEAAEKARQEAEAKLAAELAKLADATAGRYAKTTKGVAIFTMVALLFMSSVSTGMNFHNVKMLYGQIFHPVIIFIFAFVLGFIPLIFAWVKDLKKVKASTFILPTDYIITVLLFTFLNPLSPLVQNWAWLAQNGHWFSLGFALSGVGFYAYQVFLIYNKLLAIIADEKYEDFFMSLFK